MAIDSILIDTNAYAAYRRGAPEAAEIIQRTPFIGVNAIVLGELLAGFAAGSRVDENTRDLQAFLASPRARFLPLDDATARVYARVYLDLKRDAHPSPTNDMWIAATAIQYNLAVFRFDDHFQAVRGLRTGKRLGHLVL